LSQLRTDTRTIFGVLRPALAGLGAVAVLTISGGATAATGLAASSVAVGMTHTCALTKAGGVVCWGDNYHGTLGDGTRVEAHSPVQVVGLKSGVKAIAAGDYYNCALTTAGGVKCWGANDSGQLGDGTTTERLTPVYVSGLRSGVAAIAAGGSDGGHACALTDAGGVKCWGANNAGQLGDGTTVDRRRPVNVVGLTSGVVAIATGLDTSCAVKSSGAVKCWGYNGEGELGNASTANIATPVDVIGMTSGAVAVSGADGEGHTCVLMSGGTVKCWGDNVFGELGSGTTITHTTPVQVADLNDAVAIAAGGFYTCALTSTGAARCWGDNSDGELGDGTLVEHHLPAPVAGLSSGVKAISAGLSHACAVTADGKVKCWGDNAFGEVGDGTTNDRRAPVAVKLQSCVVPNVVGRLLSKAGGLLARGHCRVGTVTTKAAAPAKAGHVLAQAPGAGKKLVYGARVNLTVGRTSK
jgi:alpha-tubulin suppressor-like RCC1 family protein